MAADDSVLVAGVKPSSYAGELLQLAREFQTRAPALSALSLFMAAPSALEARVESVLEPTSLRTGVTKMDVVKMVGLALVSAGAIAFACPSLAQEEQSAPPPPPVENAPMPPAAPAVPPASPALPASEIPAMPAAPAAPPALVVRSAAYHEHVHINRKCIQSAIRKAEREARLAIERARPQMERAASDERAGEAAMRAVRAMQPEIDAAVARATREASEAMARARPEMERAIAQERISEKAMLAVRAARPQIDAAVNEGVENARNELAKAHIDAKIEARVNEALQRAQQKLDRVRVHAKIIEDDGDTGAPSDDDQ
jgi:hypothetical protein